jgi:hypothetical protein
MKLCPFCSGEMEDAALVCNHCGRNWKTGVGPSAETTQVQADTTQGQAIAGPLWPWACLAAVLVSGMLIYTCVKVQQVMH